MVHKIGGGHKVREGHKLGGGALDRREYKIGGIQIASLLSLQQSTKTCCCGSTPQKMLGSKENYSEKFSQI